MHYFRKNNLLLAGRPEISANFNQNYRRYNFQVIAKISGNITFSENLQHYSQLCAIAGRDSEMMRPCVTERSRMTR